MAHFIRSFALLATAPLAVAACGASGSKGTATSAAVEATSGPDGVQQVVIDTTDKFRFMPSAIRAHVGKLRIVLTNNGSYPHNISFPELHATSSTVTGNPGQQKSTLTISLTHAGTYEYVCTYHSSAGMMGHLTVT